MNTKKTLADAQPGGRVRLGDRPKDGEVLVEVSGLTGSGKSAIAGEIEILCKALGLDAEWVNGDEEKRLTHADWIGALEMYKPKVVIVEQNIPRAALSAQPSPGGQGEIDVDDLAQAIRKVDGRHLLGAGALAEAILSELPFLAARQPVDATGKDSLTVGGGQAVQQEPFGWWMQDSSGVGYFTRTPGPDSLAAYNSTPGYSATPLHAAPPSQAVDLGQFIALAKFGEEFAFSAEKQPHSRVIYSQASRLLALIDKAPTNG